MVITDGEVEARAITFHTVRGNTICHQTEFWPDLYEAPHWRRHWVTSIPRSRNPPDMVSAGGAPPAELFLGQPGHYFSLSIISLNIPVFHGWVMPCATLCFIHTAGKHYESYLCR